MVYIRTPQSCIRRLNMSGKIVVASVSFLAVAMMLMTAFSMPVSSAASVPVSENDKITTEVGTTTDLGGGDHFYVKFGSDASFGILWGTQDNPNDIYFVSYIARHIGYINVDEPNGTVLTQEPLKVYTLYAVKLDRLIEYSNGSGNGLLSYDPSNLIGELLAGQIYKGVNLDTAWTVSNWINGTAQNGDLTWNFTLTAKNLTYNVPLRYRAYADGNGVLDSIALTFHLTASSSHMDNITVPQWSVTLTEGLLGNDRFKDLQRENDLTVSGNITNYHVKWDKNITGWDFNPGDTNPTLLAECTVIVGNYIPPVVTGLMRLAEWQKLVGATGDNGTMIADTQNLNGSASISNAFLLHTPRLTFGGDSSRIGTFEWVRNATVDGQTKNATSQVSAIMPFNVAFGGNDFFGFLAIVGISYPGGSSIVQDPDISAQATTDLALSNGGASNGASTPGLFLVIVVVIIVVVAVAVVWTAMIYLPKKK